MNRLLTQLYQVSQLTLTRYLHLPFMGNPLGQIINFLPLSDRIATAGQPTTEQYPAIAAAGYEVVLDHYGLAEL